MSDVLISLLLIVGALLMWSGSFGVLRFPDFYNRVHAAGIPATLGVTLLLVAVSLRFLLQTGTFPLKPLFAAALLFLTIPLGTEMLARAAYGTGVKPSPNYVIDELEGKVVEQTPGIE